MKKTKKISLVLLRYLFLDIFGSYAQMSQFRSPMMMMYPGSYPVSSSPTSMMDPMNHHHHQHQQQESSAVTSGAS